MAAAVRYVFGLLASLQFLCSYTSVAQLFEEYSRKEDLFMGPPSLSSRKEDLFMGPPSLSSRKEDLFMGPPSLSSRKEDLFMGPPSLSSRKEDLFMGPPSLSSRKEDLFMGPPSLSSRKEDLFMGPPSLSSRKEDLFMGPPSLSSRKEDLLMGPPQYLGPSANVSRLLDSLMTGYDKRLRPDYKGPPVEVALSMHVSSISSISEVDMAFTVDMYFRQIWKDRRLTFSDKLSDQLCISNEMLAKIWWPDTFFANAKASKFHHTTTKNAFLRIKPSGEIVQSLRLTVTAMCNMNLMYYPMDSQLCSLEIESYGYGMDDIIYKWLEGQATVDISDEAKKLPTFTVRGIRTTTRVVELTTGNYSRWLLALQFLFGRNMGYYLIHIYIPSALIVVLSWLSFWLSCDTDRVSLGITIVLTMTALIYTTNAALPKVSYLKSIDLYLFVSFVFGIASLFETAAVSYLSNGHSRRVRTYNSDAHAPNHGVKESLTNGGSYATANIGKRSCLKPGLIDQWSRIVFPLLFCIFQLVYWIVYSCISRNDTDLTFRWFV